MGLWHRLLGVFAWSSRLPRLSERLDARTQASLAASVKKLGPERRGWITLKEARMLFSSMDDQYAFGELDDEGKRAIASFSKSSEHPSDIEFRPVEGRVYFVRR